MTYSPLAKAATPLLKFHECQKLIPDPFDTGKLPLPSQPEVWIEEQVGLQDIEVLPLQRVVLYRSGSLPPIHKDPFDRVIAAEALHRDLRLLSPDEPFAKYGCAVLW